MEKEELIKFLKDNFKIVVKTVYSCDSRFLRVELFLGGEKISSSETFID